MAPQPSDVLGDIFSNSRKIAVTGTNFSTHVLPAFAAQYLMGVLVQLNGTRFYRLALLPVAWWLARRAIFVDMSGGDPAQIQANTALITQMTSVSMRNVIWAFAQKPYRRRDERTPQKQNIDDSESENIYTAMWNAWDLMIAVRGIGWNWQRGIIFPKPILETHSRITFVALSFIKMGFHAFALDAVIQTMHMIAPLSSSSGGTTTFFNPALPFHMQLFQALAVSGLAMFMTYFGMEMGYQLLAIVFVIVFQQRPSQWPPLFNAPWLSTSLTELWSRRWHQLMRHMLLDFGGTPFNVFGRAGGVIGTFLASGVFHEIEIRSVGRGGSSLTTIAFFVMCGVGVLLERVWKKVTGRSVGGVWGRLWTFGWLALWGIPMVGAWVRIGRHEMVGLPGDLKPSVALVSFIRRWI